jgi:ribosome biogenesis GTPase
MKARVYKSTGSWYIVKDVDGNIHQARIKGKFKIGNSTSTNPIAVGDWVELEGLDTPESIVINNIHVRQNYITRTSPHNKNQHHIIAANLDQTLLFTTIREPRTSLGFIDRFLVTAEAYHIPAVLVVNKIDLFADKEKAVFEHWKNIYTNIGYPVLPISLQTGEGLDALTAMLKDKTTLFSGHSGVGKSTCINQILPDAQLRTTEVSDWSGKGMHTTTFAEMFDLPDGGSIIDTPGIRELGLFDVQKQELGHFFPEIRLRMQDCQFNNCLHFNEPHCAIKNAVLENGISEERYISYVTLLDAC